MKMRVIFIVEEIEMSGMDSSSVPLWLVHSCILHFIDNIILGFQQE